MRVIVVPLVNGLTAVVDKLLPDPALRGHQQKEIGGGWRRSKGKICPPCEVGSGLLKGLAAATTSGASLTASSGLGGVGRKTACSLGSRGAKKKISPRARGWRSGGCR